MPGDDARTAFSFDYELEAGDLREWIVADRSIRKRRINNAGIMTVLIIVASVLTVTTAKVNHRLASCHSLVPGPETRVWQWTCDTASPSDLVSQYALLFAGDVLFWFLAIGYAVNTWRLTPRRLARTWLASPRVAGRYRHEVAADGVTTVGPDGTRTLIPWSALTGVRETDKTFVVLGREAKIRNRLPKRALRDPALAPPLSDFLRAAVGPEPP
jgi:hypothetical protein